MGYPDVCLLIELASVRAKPLYSSGLLEPPIVTPKGLMALMNVPYLRLCSGETPPFCLCICWTILKLRSYSSLVVF